MAGISNPFYFESPSDRWSFTDREELVPELVRLMSERGRRLLIHGRRRMGKTSLIRHAAEKARVRSIYCDLSTVANLGEVARKLLEAAPTESGVHLARALELASKYLKSVVFSAGKISVSGELRHEESEATLEGVLNYLNERAADTDEAWTIIFDEFQEIRALGGERMDWRLRGITQPHRNLNYVFTGSDHRILAWMTNPQAPFFKQLNQLEVGPIAPAHLARWIGERAKRGGLAVFPYGAEIVATAGPCTGDIVRLAKTVFSMGTGKTQERAVAVAFDMIALNELNAEFVSHWRALPMTHRGVLRAIATDRLPMAADTIREFGLRAVSSASSAVEALVEKQFLVRTERGVVFDNPYFKRWVAFNGPAMPPVTDPAVDASSADGSSTGCVQEAPRPLKAGLAARRPRRRRAP